jgi:hypothetical protein
MVDAGEFTGIVEALLDNDRFQEALRRGIEATLLARNDVLPADDNAARIVHFHGLYAAVRAIAKVAEVHGDTQIAGKLRAVLPLIKRRKSDGKED